MQRMTFDNYKRQTKEKRLDKMVNKNKAKIPESRKIKLFNRLIEDANRRFEAKERLEAMKEETTRHKIGTERTISREEWIEIYKKR